VDDPYGLRRFVDAQKSEFAPALAELRAGAKHSHWMWFIFPQLTSLGRSATANITASILWTKLAHISLTRSSARACGRASRC
jgi:uncharacterized protein (DUF1810 family)